MPLLVVLIPGSHSDVMVNLNCDSSRSLETARDPSTSCLLVELISLTTEVFIGMSEQCVLVLFLDNVASHSTCRFCLLFYLYRRFRCATEMICTEKFGIFDSNCNFKITMCAKDVEEIVESEPIDTCNFNSDSKWGNSHQL